MDFMKNQKQVNWDKFQKFFSSFNPYEINRNGVNNEVAGLFNQLHVSSSERNNEYMLEVLMPNHVEVGNIESEMTIATSPSGKKYRVLNISIPKR